MREMDKLEVIFISGKYRGDVDYNIAHARKEAIALWQKGYAVICPHLNTAHFDGLCPDEVWLQACPILLSHILGQVI